MRVDLCIRRPRDGPAAAAADSTDRPCSNLFARLDDDTARRFHALACVEMSELDLIQRPSTKKRNRWVVSHESFSTRVVSGVEFLPLRIQVRSTSTSGDQTQSDDGDSAEGVVNIVYASYNGGCMHRAESQKSCIEVDQHLLPTSASATNVDVQPLPWVCNAESVHLEPLSANDWELLEIHASELEAGSLLSQVCVVYPSQKMPIRLGRYGDIAWVKVLDVGFDECTFDVGSGTCSDFDSDSDSSFGGLHNNRDEGLRHECLRLVADTEVVVIPKLRTDDSSQRCVLPTCNLCVYPTSEDYSREMKALFDTSSDLNGGDEPKPVGAIPECPPWFTGAIHSSTFDDLMRRTETNEKNQSDIVVATVVRAKESSVSTKSIALVVVADDVPHGCIVLHPVLRHQLGVLPLEDSVEVRIIDDNSVDKSFRLLQSEINRGIVSVELLPLDELELSPSTDSSAKPWRVPSGVCPTLFNTTGEQSAFPLDTLGLHQVDYHVPICSGTIIPSALVVGEQASKGGHRYSILRMNGEDRILSKTNDTPAVPFPVISLQQLPSLLVLSDRQAIKQNGGALGLSASHEDHASEYSHYFQRRKEYLSLNCLPAGAECLKYSVAESLIVAKDVHASSTSCIRPYRRLLVGEEGTGKTHHSLVIAALVRLCFGISSSYLDCSQLQSAPENQMRDILNELGVLFDEAATKTTPTLIIMDNIQALVPNVDTSNDDENDAMHHQQTNPILSAQVKLISDHIRYLLDQSPNVCVLATCTNATGIAPSLRTLRYFSSMIAVPTFEANQRTKLFQSMLSRLNGKSSSDFGDAGTFSSFGKRTEGYAPSDLLALAGRVAHALHINALGRLDLGQTTGSDDLLINIVQNATEEYTPASQRGLLVGNTDGSVKWEDIGGLFRAKVSLTDVILRPVRYRAIYQNAPITLPRGILLYGPSGCGKSVMVPALAKECNFNLVRCNGPELLDKYIGASEAKVRQLFARAYAAAPCILFLDDFDALAPRRGSDHTGVTDRVVNQLLTFLDGVESADDRKGMVYIIGASSRPDKIDPALLRPGRLEKHVYIGYANTDEEWTDLFTRIASSRALEPATMDYISSGRLLQEHGGNLSHLRRLSAADLKAVMDTAHLLAVHEYLRRVDECTSSMSAGSDASATDRVRIEMKHVLEALRSCRPSLGGDDRRMLASIYSQFYSAGGGRIGGKDRSAPPLGDYDVNDTNQSHRAPPMQKSTLK